jgi:hypothetical protein
MQESDPLVSPEREVLFPLDIPVMQVDCQDAGTHLRRARSQRRINGVRLCESCPEMGTRPRFTHISLRDQAEGKQECKLLRE